MSTASAAPAAATGSGAAPVAAAGSGAHAVSTGSGAAPATPVALRAFVLAGVRADPSRYAYSADVAGEALRRNTAGDVSFVSPSGNIACDLRPDRAAGTVPQAVCWVQQLAERAPRPASCGLDWAPGVVDVTPGRVEVGLCTGGEPLARFARTLPYGSTLVLGSVACRSDARFVACADLGSGDGFRADRSSISAVRC